MKTNIKKTLIFISFVLVVFVVACSIVDLVKGEVGYSVKGVFVKSSASGVTSEKTNKPEETNVANKDDKTEEAVAEIDSDKIKDDTTEPSQEGQTDVASSDGSESTPNEQPAPEVQPEQPASEVQPVEPVQEPAPEVQPAENTPTDSGRYAYLTFDDGPSDNTLRILDILDTYGVKATFFVIYHEGYDDYYKQIVNRGNTIALHSFSHKYNQIYSSEAAYYEDLANISNHVNAVTGVQTNIIRFPGGSSNGISKKFCPGVMTALVASTQANGYIYQDWNVDSMDASDRLVDAGTILNSVLTGATGKNNAYILMHDTSVKTTTADALPAIIEGLIAQGYTIIPMTSQTPPCHHSVVNN